MEDENKKGHEQEEMQDSHQKSIRKRRKRKEKKNKIFLVIILFIIILIGGVGAAYIYLPNFTEQPFYEYFADINRNSLSIIIKDKRVENNIPFVEKDGERYFPVDFVKKYIDPYIFWDSAVGKLTVTTADKVIRMNTEELTYYVNQVPMELNLPVYNMDGIAFIPENVLTDLYQVSINFSENYKTAIIDLAGEGLQEGKILVKNASVRYYPDKKSPIEVKLPKESSVYLFEEEGKFTRVRTTEGLLGYVPTEQVEKTVYISMPISPEPEPYQIKPVEGKITMVWDAIESVEQNTNEDSRILHDGLDVLSPTWFSMDESTLDGEFISGDIINIGHKSYVNWAHQNGYQVWPTIKDNFKSKVSHAMLSNTDTREHVIKQILAYVAMYNLDGINVDFEKIREEDAHYYVQFFRELAPYMHEQGAVLSVDMYVPKWTKHYNRTEVAKVVDYVCVMAYDETTLFDQFSGPVASIGFVEEGIMETLKEVPPEKIILGIPFYTRIWREEEIDGKIDLSIRNVGVNLMKKLISENNVEPIWLEDKGSYYGEYTATEEGNEVVRRFWQEDERSIELKLQLFEEYNLAGVAGWRRGLESEEVWGLFKEHVK